VERFTKITAKPTLDSNICEFHIDQIMYHNEDFNCSHQAQVEDSALLQMLFAIEGISQVLVSKQKITVLKQDAFSWITLGKKIGSAIRQVIDSNQSIYPSSALRDNQSDLNVATLQKLLDNTINPNVATHGGHIKVEKYETNKVFIILSGGCQGCSQSTVTIRNGIEDIIKRHYPTVTEIIDVTEHQLGDNPYYS